MYGNDAPGIGGSAYFDQLLAVRSEEGHNQTQSLPVEIHTQILAGVQSNLVVVSFACRDLSLDELRRLKRADVALRTAWASLRASRNQRS